MAIFAWRRACDDLRRPLRSRRRRHRTLAAESLEVRRLLSASDGGDPARVLCCSAEFLPVSLSAIADCSQAEALPSPTRVTVAPSGDYRIDDILGGYKWGTSAITYSFYDGGSYYGSESSPTPLSAATRQNVRHILTEVIAPLINVTFTEVPDSPTSYGLMRYLGSTSAGYGYAYYPTAGNTNTGTSADRAGDVVLNPTYDQAGSNLNYFQLGPGSHGWQALVHETCHALGLKHPGDYNGSGTGEPPYLPLGEDNTANSVMTYNFYSGDEPSTPLSYDLLALQYLYGANLSTRSADTTYVFTAVDAFSPGGSSNAPSSTFSRSKQLLWDGAGTDTVDLSGLPFAATGYRIDIQPGGWITTTSAYNAVGYDASTGSPTVFSSGSTYFVTNFGTRMPLSNAVIESIVVTRSPDAMFLNTEANTVSGYAPAVPGGADVIYGSDQLDILDLSLFNRTDVTQSQSGNDLVLDLGTAGAVTVKDYFAVTPGSRMLVRYKPDTSIVITSSLASLKAGDTATLTFTLGMSSTNFTASDVTASSGTLTGFAGSGTSYTAAYTPAANFAGTTTITVAAGSFTDITGTPNAAGSLQLAVDSVAPTVTITQGGSNTLKIGDTATISFALSESSTNLSVTDITVSGGSLSGFTGSGGSYTAVFTPAANFAGSALVTVPAGVFTDAIGNPNDAGGPLGIAVDTVAPAVSISRNGTATLRIGDVAVISFVLSVPSTTFTLGDITVTGGALANFSGSGATFMATFTPMAGFTGNATVSVAAGAFTNAIGNPNAAASLAIPVDTVAPIVSIARIGSGTLTIGRTAGIVFTISEPVTTFTAADVTVTGGVLSGFTGLAAAYSATFTPTAGFAGIATIAVAAGAVTDAAGNPNTAGGPLSIAVDTVAPTVAITWAGNSPLAAGDTAAVTFTLSEPSATFTAGDVTVGNGSLSTFSGSGRVYTATFTPRVHFAGTATLAVAAGVFSDAAGNGNLAGQTTAIPVDTVAPSIVGFGASSPAATLRIGDSVTLFTRFSEPMTPRGYVTVRLNSGGQARLVADPDGVTARGIYTVLPGEVAADLDVVAIVPNGTLRSASGKPIAPTLPASAFSLATRHDIVVDGAVKLRDPGSGFSTDPSLIRDLGTVREVPIRFTTAVSGVTASSFRLWLDGTLMPLVGAVVKGSGQAYTLLLPVGRIRPFGIYRLEVAPGAGIRATANGALVSSVASVHWGQGSSVGMVPSVPQSLVATRATPVGDRIAARLTWAAARPNAGGALTGYLVEYRVVGSSQWTRVRLPVAASPTPSPPAAGLPAGSTYASRVAAMSPAGIGGYAVSKPLLAG